MIIPMTEALALFAAAARITGLTTGASGVPSELAGEPGPAVWLLKVDLSCVSLTLL
ncbi:hypothetical protein D9M72_326620 [compost metagenome]